MQISETEFERDYHVFTDDKLHQLGVTRRVFYINTQLSTDEITRCLADFKAALGTS